MSDAPTPVKTGKKRSLAANRRALAFLAVGGLLLVGLVGFKFLGGGGGGSDAAVPPAPPAAAAAPAKAPAAAPPAGPAPNATRDPFHGLR